MNIGCGSSLGNRDRSSHRGRRQAEIDTRGRLPAEILYRHRMPQMRLRYIGS